MYVRMYVCTYKNIKIGKVLRIQFDEIKEKYLNDVNYEENSKKKKQKQKQKQIKKSGKNKCLMKSIFHSRNILIF